MNTGTVRILIIVALVVGGIAVLANGFADSGSGTVALPTGAAPTSTTTPKPTATATEQPPSAPSPQVTGVATMVFNGTNIVGLGAQVQDAMFKEGYQFPVDAGNPPQSLSASIVYFRGGANEAQNEADARYVADTFVNGAKVKKLSPDFESLIDRSVTVVVVVGADFSVAP